MSSWSLSTIPFRIVFLPCASLSLHLSRISSALSGTMTSSLTYFSAEFCEWRDEEEEMWLCSVDWADCWWLEATAVDVVLVFAFIATCINFNSLPFYVFTFAVLGSLLLSTIRELLLLLVYWELTEVVAAFVISLPNSLGLSTNLEFIEVSLPYLFSLFCTV